jgi:mRNA interferase YafQ
MLTSHWQRLLKQENFSPVRRSYTAIFSAKIMHRKNRFHIVETKQYRRDVRRIFRMDRFDLHKLDTVINLLASGSLLPKEYKNHKLHGEYEGCNECHIQSDWLLIYRICDDVLILQLIRTGRHAELFEE